MEDVTSLSPDDQREAIRLVQVEKRSQGQVAARYKVDRSTISRMMTEVRLKQDLKGGVFFDDLYRIVGFQCRIINRLTIGNVHDKDAPSNVV